MRIYENNSVYTQGSNSFPGFEVADALFGNCGQKGACSICPVIKECLEFWDSFAVKDYRTNRKGSIVRISKEQYLTMVREKFLELQKNRGL